MTTKRTIWTVLGMCSAALAFAPQAGRAGEQGFFVGLDAGVALGQDVALTRVNGQDLPLSFNMAGFSTTLDQPKFQLGTGTRLDLMAGYNFSESLALELETGFLYNPINTLTTSGVFFGVPFTEDTPLDLNLWQVPLLANVVYTIPLHSNFKPFIGAGAGGIWSIISGEGSTEYDFTFAFQGLAGVKYVLSDRADIGVVYKFLGTLSHDFGDVKTDPFYTSSILAIFTLRF
jgi:OmpA-OmpF porin, OOP family